MVDFFDGLYAAVLNKNKFLEKIRFYSALRFAIRWCANSLLPYYFLLTRKDKRFSLQTKNSNESIVVSLTSFPTRIGKVWLVIETILRQSTRPDKLILWLSTDQFSSLDELPKLLLAQQERGLEIRLENGNLLSHKKYFYTRRDFPDEMMITFDDDIFYPSNTVKELLEGHKTFPLAVIARYGYRINAVENEIAPYETWEPGFLQESPDILTFFGSGGGTLFPANSLPDVTLNQDIFMKLCKYADDIWLNTVCRLNERKVWRIQSIQRSLLPVVNKNKASLYTKNLGENLNDKQLRNVRDHFILTCGIDPYSGVLDPLDQKVEVYLKK